MANPFIYHKSPVNAREHQDNANYMTYERMAADEALRDCATQETIANAHTMHWVEKEYIRLARAARAVERR